MNMDDTSSKLLRVLMVEDSEDDALLLRCQLEGAGYQVQHARVDTRETLSKALDDQAWDIVFSDFSMPQFNGMEALKTVREHDSDVPFIIVSGTIGEERAVQLMKSGAQDYLLKGHIKRLLPAVARELKDAQLRREHRQAQDHIRHLAYYDSLTGLPNRACFLERLAEQIDKQRSGHDSLTVLTVDLTASYDEINTTLGYSTGDTLLCQAAERLKNILPAGNTLSVLGTARFAAILAPGNLDYAYVVVEHIQQKFSQPFDIAGFRLSTGVSAGTAQYPEHGADPQLLLRHAEMALVFSRRNPSGYATYSEKLDPSNSENLELATELREAIEGGLLHLCFQPKIDLTTGQLKGVEALTRWQHPQKGAISPDRFIPLAEKASLINPLTLWLLGAAVDQHLLWRANGLNIPIAVNLSVRNLVDRRLLKHLYALLIDRRLEPGAIEVEITESALMEDPQHSLKTLQALRDLGIRIYVDDFGTGYSSLGYLKRLPIDAIKIDKSFVSDMTDNADSASIVRSTVDLAHNLGLQVVAEGVENRATFKQLANLGCDVGQGYLIGHPMPPNEFLNWYKDYIPSSE